MFKIIVICGLLSIGNADDFALQYDQTQNAHFPIMDQNTFMKYMNGLLLVPKIHEKDEVVDRIGFNHDVRPVVEPNTEPPPTKNIFTNWFNMPPPISMQGNDTRANFQHSVDSIMQNSVNNQFAMLLNDAKRPNFPSTSYGVPVAPTQSAKQQAAGPFVPSSITIQGHTMQTQPIQYQFVLANNAAPGESSFSSSGPALTSPENSGETTNLPKFSDIGIDPKFQPYNPPTTAEAIKDQAYYNEVINKLKQFDFGANQQKFEAEVEEHGFGKPLSSGFGATSYGDFPMIENPYKINPQESKYEENKQPFSLDDVHLQRPLKFAEIPKQTKHKVLKVTSYSEDDSNEQRHVHRHTNRQKLNQKNESPPKNFANVKLDYDKSAFEPKYVELHSYEDASSGENTQHKYSDFKPMFPGNNKKHKYEETEPTKHKYQQEDPFKPAHSSKKYKPDHYKDFPGGFGSPHDFSEMKPYKFNADDGKQRHNKREQMFSSSNIKNSYERPDDIFKPKIVKSRRTTRKPKHKKAKVQGQKYVVKIVKRM